MAANRPSDAINAWQELLKINPEDSEAAYSLGSTLLNQKRFADAISPLEVIKSSPGKVFHSAAHARVCLSAIRQLRKRASRHLSRRTRSN